MGSPPPPSASSGGPLRVIFMGTPALAAHILDRLVAAAGADYQVVAVVTRPDQPRKRGLRLEPSEVGATAAHHGLTTLKPVKIRTPEFLAELKSFVPDVLAIAAYGRILPNAILDAPRLMPINVHASLLPRHRGAAPIEGAILAGDAVSGVTIMRVIEQMDAGPILLQRSISLASDETQGSLKTRLAELGAEASIETLALMRRGAINETPQDEARATYTSPIEKEHAIIDWRGDAAQIERAIRAYDPWPVARTTFDSVELLIWRATVVADAEPAGEEPIDAAPPGAIVSLKPAPIVQCGFGRLALVEVQAPGRRRMSAVDFMRGRRPAVGMRLGG
jgi:methionyl-tRNA formyltransferase